MKLKWNFICSIALVFVRINSLIDNIDNNIDIDFKNSDKKFINKLLSNVYFEKNVPNMKFDWRKIYILPSIITIDTYLKRPPIQNSQWYFIFE